MCQNLRLFDHFAPDLRLLLEESLGFGGRAAGGVQVDLGEMRLRLRTVEHVIDRLVELGDDGWRRIWRRGDGVPGARLESFHANFVECRDVGQVRNTLSGRLMAEASSMKMKSV